MDSYGYVETRGLVTAIEAADTALKAANVTLTNCYYVKGGIVTIEVMGDVAAVTAAVDAATESARRLGNFLSSNVIARVDSETKKILVSDIGKKTEKNPAVSQIDEKIIEKKNDGKIVEVIEQAAENLENNENQFTEEQSESITEKIEAQEKMEDVIQETVEEEKQNSNTQENEEISITETLKKKDEETKKIKKQYQDMKVADLKTKVNSLKLGYTWNQIKTMPKKKLIEILIKNSQEE